MAAEGLEKETGEGEASEGADLHADHKVKGLLRWTGQMGPVTRRPARCGISSLLPFVASAPFLYPLITRPSAVSFLAFTPSFIGWTHKVTCRVSRLGVRPEMMELLRQTVPPAQMGSGDCSAFPPAQPPVSFHLWPVATSKHSVVDRKSKMAGVKGSNL